MHIKVRSSIHSLHNTPPFFICRSLSYFFKLSSRPHLTFALDRWRRDSRQSLRCRSGWWYLDHNPLRLSVPSAFPLHTPLTLILFLPFFVILFSRHHFCHFLRTPLPRDPPYHAHGCLVPSSCLNSSYEFSEAMLVVGTEYTLPVTLRDDDGNLFRGPATLGLQVDPVVLATHSLHVTHSPST